MLVPPSVSGRELFPLPLTAMEQFWLWDDSAAYPKRFRVVVTLRGSVNLSWCEQALSLALSRHPLLLAHLAFSEGKPHWILPSHPQIAWRWEEGSWNVSPFSDRWDLTNEAGLRMWGSRSGERIELVMEAHHACTDGMGLRQFFGDFTSLYDRLARGEESPLESLKRLEPHQLNARGLFRRPPTSDESRSTTLWEKITQAYDFHFRGPSPILSRTGSRPPAAESSPPIVERVIFSEAETMAIDERMMAWTKSRSRPYSLNDHALAIVLQAIDEWNGHQRSLSPRTRWRIMVPTDLRGVQDHRTPAANRLGFGFVVADHSSCRDYPSLIDLVTFQTQAIRRLRLGLDFVEIFTGLARYPRLGQFLVRRPRCLATAVLTNMGDVSRRHRRALDGEDGKPKMGELVVEEVTAFPPLRPFTHLGIGLCRCAGKLSIGLIADRRRFDHEDARRFLDVLADAWRRACPPQS